MTTKYPSITVMLTGADGNVFNIMGLVNRALKVGGIDEREREEFKMECMSGDYDHVIQTCFLWVNVE